MKLPSKKLVNPKFSQTDFDKWYIIQQKLKDLKIEEAKLRRKIFKSAFPVAHEGTNTLDLTEGYVLKAFLPINRKVDEETFLLLKDQLAAVHIKADSLVIYKPELHIKYYHILNAEQIDLVDQFLIISDGSPQLEVVLPAKNKKDS
jgi:hypothetical protein